MTISNFLNSKKTSSNDRSWVLGMKNVRKRQTFIANLLKAKFKIYFGNIYTYRVNDINVISHNFVIKAFMKKYQRRKIIGSTKTTSVGFQMLFTHVII